MNIEEHRKQTVSGLKWNIASQIITQASIFIISITLMRFLGPEQYGLLGMVTVFSGFLSVFKDFGLNSALIQKKEIDDIDKNTVFWISLALGTTLALLLVIGSPLLAVFYQEPKVTIIAIVLSSLFVFQSLGSTHNALLRKKLQYKKLFWVSTTSVLVAGTVALVAAFNNYGVWALVIQQLLASFLGMVVLWNISPFRPKFVFSKDRLKDHLNFGLPLVGTQSFNYWSRNADNLLIGRFLGAQQLGIYTRAYSIMMLPVSQISGVIASVMFPSLAIIQDDKERVKNIYLKMSRVIAFVTFPLMGILIVTAEPFVNVILGSQWTEMVSVLRILAVVGALQSIGTLNGNIFMSQGKTKLQFQLNVIGGMIIILAFYISVFFNIEAVAFAYLIAVLIIMPPKLYIMGKLISCKLPEILFNLLPHLLITTVLVGISFFVLQALSFFDDIYLLILGILAFSFGWLILMYLFDRKLIKEILSLRHEFINRRSKIKS